MIKSLSGQSILVTRPASQTQTLVESLDALGASTTVHPVIEIAQIESADGRELIQTTLEALPGFDGLVFVSTNGVKWFFQELENHDFGRSSQSLVNDLVARCRLVAIGSATALAIQNQLPAVTPSLSIAVPSASNSESLAEYLIEHCADERLLILRANRGSDVLRRELERAGQRFLELPIYCSGDVRDVEPAVAKKLDCDEIDWITMTSSASAQAALKLFGQWLADVARQTPSGQPSRLKIASISPTTSAAIRNAGFEPTVEAAEFNMEGLVEAMVSWTVSQ